MSHSVIPWIVLVVVLLIFAGILLMLIFGENPEYKRIDEALDRIGQTQPEVVEAVLQQTGG